MANSINIEELNELLKNKSAVTLLDVRRKSDYEASPQKIKGAVWNNPETIDTWSEYLPGDTLTVAYCVKGGSVSQSIADKLQQKGLKTVFLEGGINAWVENGEPVEDIA